MGLTHIGQPSFRESLGISQNTCPRRMTASANRQETVRGLHGSRGEGWGAEKGTEGGQIKSRGDGRELSLSRSPEPGRQGCQQPCRVCVLQPLCSSRTVTARLWFPAGDTSTVTPVSSFWCLCIALPPQPPLLLSTPFPAFIKEVTGFLLHSAANPLCV